MSDTFVRESFYIDPPNKNASVKEWQAWDRADGYRARAARIAYTKSFEQQDAPEYLQDMGMRKVNGVWQQCLPIGFTGSVDANDLAGDVIDIRADLNAIVVARDMESRRNKRGGSRKGKSARRRKNRHNRNR